MLMLGNEKVQKEHCWWEMTLMCCMMADICF